MCTQLACRKTAGQRTHLPCSTHRVHRRFTSRKSLSTDISDNFKILRRLRRECPCRRFAPPRAAAATPADTFGATAASGRAPTNCAEAAAADAAAAAEARQTSQPSGALPAARSPTASRSGLALPLALTSTRVPRCGPCLSKAFVVLDLSSHTDAPPSQPPAAAASAGAAAAAEPPAEAAAGARAADCGAAGRKGFGGAPRNNSMCSYRACAARCSEGKVPMYLPPAMANHTASRPSRAVRL
mmetsp:Transcript_89356/g.227292  ORF Transcript_89356/g.227292 Transcript_89356/m.227292 type:complete len:242 (+) Transcript_89356:53-778(+)